MISRLWMLPVAVLLAIFLLRAAATLAGSEYDWDIDHMMYFGGRLLHGELVWTREYDDKLPIVQFLFALPAAVGSVRMWGVLSILSVLAAATALVWGLQILLRRDWFLGKSASRATALSAGTLYLYLAAVSTGSLIHINPMAASLMTLATVLLLVSGHREKVFLRDAPGLLVISALLASIAVSMRPYFLAPALLAGLWGALRASIVSELRADAEPNYVRPPIRNRFSFVADFLLWVAALGTIGLVLNAAPYLLTGQMGSFLDGLWLTSQTLNPMSVRSTLWAHLRGLWSANDFTFFVVACWAVFAVGSAVWILCNRRNPAPDVRIYRVDILFAVLLSPISLALVVMSKHYWSHYEQFYIPYAVFSSALMIAFLLKLGWFEGVNSKASRTLKLFLILALLVAVRGDVKYGVTALVRSKDFAAAREIDRRALQDYFYDRDLLSADFLNPGHMYLHWTLDHPRHGFPHAANTNHIFRNWWVDVRRPPGLDVPTTPQEYCAKIEREGPRFVVDRLGYWVLDCFTENTQSRYVQVQLLELSDGSQLAIYERMK